MAISLVKKHKIFQISSNSFAIVIPRAIFDFLKLERGMALEIGIDLETNQIIIIGGKTEN